MESSENPREQRVNQGRPFGFHGTHPYRIDPKGRVPIPPDFREAFKEGVTLVEGAERCIMVFPPASWQQLIESYASSQLGREKQRRLNRALFSGASVEKLDAQGRVPVPPLLRQYAGVVDEAVVVGVNTHLEIWERKAWEREQERVREERWQLLETLEESK